MTLHAQAQIPTHKALLHVPNDILLKVGAVAVACCRNTAWFAMHKSDSCQKQWRLKASIPAVSIPRHQLPSGHEAWHAVPAGTAAAAQPGGSAANQAQNLATAVTSMRVTETSDEEETTMCLRDQLISRCAEDR